MFKVAPLQSNFMLVAMFGFLITAYYTTHPIFKSWAWSFMIIFIIMFIASMISMSNAPLTPEHLDNLAIHDKDHFKKRKKAKTKTKAKK